MSEEKIIFSMAGVGKNFPPKKQVLKDIYLSFFYGALMFHYDHNNQAEESLLKYLSPGNW